MSTFKKLKKEAEKMTKCGKELCRKEILKIQFEIITMCNAFNQLIVQLVNNQVSIQLQLKQYFYFINAFS